MPIKQIEATLPGIVYLSPGPDVPPFKAPGDAVAAGDTIALVEIMKSFLPIEADVAGRFVAYRVTNNAALEGGEIICEIETA